MELCGKIKSMTIPLKTLKNGFSMPVYGLGTWQMGGRNEHDPKNDDEADIAAIKAAIDSGITHLDTAESYAAGYSEILVEKAIKGFNRKKLFIASKAHVEHLGYDDLINAAKASLKRLEISYLDLYYAHSYSHTIPAKETMQAMDALVEEGLIKNIGVSNFTVEEMKEAQSYAKHKVAANQLHLNLKYREAERKGLLAYCQKNDVMFVAWRPLQMGMNLDIPILQEIAKKYNKTPAQVALDWLISQDNVVTLSKTRNTSHLKENLGAVGWQMEWEDVEKLRRDFPNQEDISDTVPLV